jgi:hypothetical protein
MKHLIYLIAVMALLAVAQTAQGAVLSSCDQWASYCSGAYCVYNDIWNPQGSWSQCITASSCTSWSVVATHTGTGVKSFPNSSYENVGKTIGAGGVSSSVSSSCPSSGDWNFSYDIWCPNEFMIWLKWNGAVGPWGSYVTSATIDGSGWDVYKNGYPGYLKQSQTTGGTFNISAFLQDSVNRGWNSSGNTIGKCQCGIEFTAVSNQTFTMNSYSVSTGSASTTTTAASTTTTAASTTTSTTSNTTSTTSASTSTTTTSGGSCSCGTCSWWGTQVPTCCQSCSGWGWQDGGCNRSCVCSGSCPNN